MTPSSLVIVADRGSLKAYRVKETPTRGASLELVNAFDTTAAHGRFQDKVTDQAGRFSVSDATGGVHSGIAERQALESETDRRLYKQLAENIAQVVKRDATDGWSFAAPASIYSAILELLPPDIRDRIVEHVKSDLVKTEVANFPKHFRSLHPV